MVEYSDSEFKKKLKFLTVSQKAIQSLSTWCLERHEHYKSIITIWSNTIKKVKIKKRLLLFYLANHVIQYSKRHNYKFVDRWKIAIQKAIPYVRDEEILSKITRVIKIWKERHVYNHSYLADLTGLLTTQNQKLKLADPVQGCQACFKNAEKVKLLQKKLKSFISSMPTDYRLPSPDINQSFSSTSSTSIEDLNMYNINYDTVLNSDNIDSIYNTDIYVPTTINNIKSCITPEKTITDQELYDPASVSIPAMEIDDQQPLTIQFPDTPSPPPDETFTNYNNKSSIYSTSSDEDYVHTPMSFTDQFTTSEVSINMAPSTNSSSVINENIIPVSHVPQPGLDVTVHNDGSSNDTPASNYKGIGIDHCALASKITDKDEIVTPEMINKMSVIDHRNLISLTHSFHNSSPTASDYQAFSNSIIQPPKLNLLMKSIIKSQNNLDNLEIVDMDLSDSQKHSVPLLPPLPPPFQPPVKPPPPPLPMPTSTPPQSPLSLPSPMIPPTPLPMSKSMQPPLPPPYSPPIKPPPPPPPPPPIKPYTPTLMPPQLSQPMKPPTPLPMSTSTQPPLPPSLQPPIKPPPPPLPPQMIQPTPPPPMLTLLSQPMPISMLPPLPLPMKPSTLPPMPTSIPSYFYSPFNLVYKSVPDVTYQLEQSSKPWRKDRPSLNKIQSNKEQLSQCYSKFVSNQPQTQWPIHVQGIKSTKDFTPNGKDIYFSSRDPRKFNRHSTPVGTLNQESLIGSEKSNLNCRKIEEPAPTPLNRK